MTKNRIKKNTVVTAYEDFTTIGGAEKVAINLHRALKERHNIKCLVMARNSFSANQQHYGIQENEYIRLSFGNILKLKNCTIISHHRKTTTQIELLNRLLHLNIRILHVAHNEFTNLRHLTLLPKDIVSVSERVKDNLINYFGIDSNRIKVIYNGLPDVSEIIPESFSPANQIQILYPARITKVKRQLDLIENTRGLLDAAIMVNFAGDGELADAVRSMSAGSTNFRYLGFVDLQKEFHRYDYVLLFSEKEGLPLSLIEACSFSKPIVCNNVGGNAEIVRDGYNGFVANTYRELIDILNGLPARGTPEYEKMCRNSRSHYEQVFSERTMLHKYLQLIEG